MKLSDFDYELPVQFIAQHPVEPRDSSRLMVLNRTDGCISHTVFHQITDYVYPGDTLVFNDSRVLPARLKGTIKGSDKPAEILLLKKLAINSWEALVRPGRKLPVGSQIALTNGNDVEMTATIIGRSDNGIRMVEFSHPHLLEVIGEIPLPPYIKAKLKDGERYQTVYSRYKGSAAAPTAGLHFTPSLLDSLREKGVNLAFITLHIGLDTFQPVRTEKPENHRLHTEYGHITAETAEQLNTARKAGKRLIAVGTTTVRLLEAASTSGKVQPFDGMVDIFILPGFRFHATDAMITNFHLPRSTLLMMVSAFAGREFILQAYEQAKQSGYRFYSFGDAMLIL